MNKWKLQCVINVLSFVTRWAGCVSKGGESNWVLPAIDAMCVSAQLIPFRKMSGHHSADDQAGTVYYMYYLLSVSAQYFWDFHEYATQNPWSMLNKLLSAVAFNRVYLFWWRKSSVQKHAGDICWTCGTWWRQSYDLEIILARQIVFNRIITSKCLFCICSQYQPDSSAKNSSVFNPFVLHFG